MTEKGLDEKTQEFGEKDFGEREELGAENVESHSVENDGETLSSNKRIKEMSIDRLSALPDSVLIHILSFLEMEEAAITSVLSKRWQFLWTELPRLELEGCTKESEKIHEFVAGVHRILLNRRNYLEKFGVYFTYDEGFASDVDAWVEFAVKNKVKEVTLWLYSDEDFYTLPQMMYSDSSLTNLSVCGCIMAPQRTIQWQSLTSLAIDDMVLPQHVIEKILSGCPVLYSLHLRGCWGFKCLEVNTQNLYKLGLYDCEDKDNEPLLEISALYIQSLTIWLYPKGRKLQLTNITSLVTADISFTGYDWSSSSLEVTSNTKELFESIQHVKELRLERRCFEVLSMLVVNGWQLPNSRRRCLTVNTLSDDEHNISGIVGLLESSPVLETLVIEGCEPDGVFDTWDPPMRGDLDCDLLHLKTVKIIDFANPKLGGEPMLTLARILLKRATVLEEMVIGVNVEDIDDFVKIRQILLTYPRSSQKAVIRLP